ncbi:unnamed protein product [Phaedon cochleariae]|uniref:Doublecortin domain-containing protein n=1 Tax=Phaedon cochleariae TaxID=80249 RepID=A0A9N9X4Q8_PHACE|nr:unnamed protein product [Phaedon cochleariae]
MESFLNSHFHLLSEPTFGRAKKIRVWINGDVGNKCFDISLNPNVLRTWNSILQYLTHTIHPPFGAIRKLICLSSRKAVTCFEELEAREKYIAMGINSKLIILKEGYNSPSEQELLKPKKTSKKFYSGDINSLNFQFLQETKKRNLTVIFIVVNGQACQSPTKVVLNENDLGHWSVILKYLSKILDVPEGIQQICTIFGDVVMDPLELQHGYLYVALPFNEKFENIDYTNTFGRASNKSSYVLKIRKKIQPSKVCCPIREKTSKRRKTDCLKPRCLKEFDDERECHILLPEEIPESCRTVRIEDEKGGEAIDMVKGKDCCLQNKETNLWCRIKKYNPGCCDKADGSGVLKKDRKDIKPRTVKERKKSLNEMQSKGIITDTNKEIPPVTEKASKKEIGETTVPQIDQLYKRNSHNKNGEENNDNVSSPDDDLTAKDSPPTQQLPEKDADEKESTSVINSAPDQQNSEDSDDLNESEPLGDSKPTQEDKNTSGNNIDAHEKLSLDSIEESNADNDPNLLEQEIPQKNDQIVTYFSIVDKVPTKDKKPSLSTTISRGTQTMADFTQSQSHAHHVTISSACLPRSSIAYQHETYGQKRNEDEEELSRISAECNGDEKNQATGSICNAVDKNPIEMSNSLLSKIDKCINTEISLMQERRNYMSEDNSKFSQSNEFYKPEHHFENKVNRGISAILSEMNVYPDHEPRRMPSICIKNITDINVVGYSKNGKRHKRDNIKCYESSSLSESSSAPEYGNIEKNDHLCRFCREARNLDGSISRICRSKHVSESKNKRRTEKRNDCAEMNLESPSENPDFDNTPNKTDNNISTNAELKKNSQKSRSSKISEKVLNITTDSIEDSTIPEKIVRTVVENYSDTEIIPVSDITEDKKATRKSSKRSSIIRTYPEQKLPKSKSSGKRSTSSAALRFEKIPDDDDSVKVSERPQSLKKIPEDGDPLLGSEDLQQSLPTIKTSQRNSATSAVQKIMKTIEDDIPFIEKSQSIENNVSILDSEERQQNSSKRRISTEESAFSIANPKTPRNSVTTLGRNAPPLDSEAPQESSSIRKSTKRNSCCRELRKGKCKLQNPEKLNVDNIPELDCETGQKNCTRSSGSYSNAILNVRKILEDGMAEITEVLSKKQQNSDQNKTEEIPSNQVADPQQDLVYSSSSDDTMAYFP